MEPVSIGFEIPMVGLVLGLAILVVGLFVGGLNVVSYAGIAIGFLSIVALASAAVNVPEAE